MTQDPFVSYLAFSLIVAALCIATVIWLIVRHRTVRRRKP